MNRIVFLSLLAVVAATGCSNSEVGSPATGGLTASVSDEQALSTKIVGTWRDVGKQTTETYGADGTVDSNLNEPVTVPVSEAGFKGAATTHVTANAKGTWTLNGDKLQVAISDVTDLTVGPVTIKEEENLLGGDLDLAEIGTALQAELQRDLPEMIAGQTVTVTIVSLAGDKLITKDEEGLTEEHIRVKP
jgi:hypothetical protein